MCTTRTTCLYVYILIYYITHTLSIEITRCALSPRDFVVFSHNFLIILLLQLFLSRVKKLIDTQKIDFHFHVLQFFKNLQRSNFETR